MYGHEFCFWSVLKTIYRSRNPCTLCFKQIWKVGKVGKIGKAGKVGKVGVGKVGKVGKEGRRKSSFAKSLPDFTAV